MHDFQRERLRSLGLTEEQIADLLSGLDDAPKISDDQLETHRFEPIVAADGAVLAEEIG